MLNFGDHVRVNSTTCGTIVTIKTGRWGGHVATVHIHHAPFAPFWEEDIYQDIDLGLLEKFGGTDARD